MSGSPISDAEVYALLEQRLREHGLDRADARRVDAYVHSRGPHGPTMSIAYRRADGTSATRLLILSHAKHDPRGGWRWEEGARAKGSALVLGDPLKAATVLVCEGESDTLAMWRHLSSRPDQFAVIGIPGSNMVGPDLAAFLGNTAQVIIATDADDPGDKCAADVARVLSHAGHDSHLVLRYRPHLKDRDELDLRDVIEDMEAEGATHEDIIEWVTGSAKPITPTSSSNGSSPTTKVPPPEAAEIEAPTAHARPGVLTLANVKEAPIEWLATGLIPLAALTLLVGQGGLGKTTWALDVAARVTRGREVLPSLPTIAAAGVLIVSAEDAVAQVLVPRLRLAGADLTRVHTVDLSEQGLSVPDDVPWLHQQIGELGVKLVVLDPLPAFIGGKIDAHKDASLRSALRPLHAMAESLNVAVLGIAHVNKSAGSDVGQRVSGSAAWVNAARSALVFGPKPGADDTDPARILAVGKSNYGKRGTSHELTLRVPAGEDHPVIAYVGASTVQAHEVLAATNGEERSKREEAQAFLLQELDDGDRHRSSDVIGRGQKDGHKIRTLQRAANDLGLEITHDGFPRITYWRLPWIEHQPESGGDA